MKGMAEAETFAKDTCAESVVTWRFTATGGVDCPMARFTVMFTPNHNGVQIKVRHDRHHIRIGKPSCEESYRFAAEVCP